MRKTDSVSQSFPYYVWWWLYAWLINKCILKVHRCATHINEQAPINCLLVAIFFFIFFLDEKIKLMSQADDRLIKGRCHLKFAKGNKFKNTKKMNFSLTLFDFHENTLLSDKENKSLRSKCDQSIIMQLFFRRCNRYSVPSHDKLWSSNGGWWVFEKAVRHCSATRISS